MENKTVEEENKKINGKINVEDTVKIIGKTKLIIMLLTLVWMWKLTRVSLKYSL